eukprot:scaffold313438_cov33-Tisochrysis_lutea.AAC.1
MSEGSSQAQLSWHACGTKRSVLGSGNTAHNTSDHGQLPPLTSRPIYDLPILCDCLLYFLHVTMSCVVYVMIRDFLLNTRVWVERASERANQSRACGSGTSRAACLLMLVPGYCSTSSVRSAGAKGERGIGRQTKQSSKMNKLSAPSLRARASMQQAFSQR